MFPYLTRVVVCYVNIRYNILFRKDIFKSFILAIKIATKYVWGIPIKKYNMHFSFVIRIPYLREKKRFRKSYRGGVYTTFSSDWPEYNTHEDE